MENQQYRIFYTQAELVYCIPGVVYQHCWVYGAKCDEYCRAAVMVARFECPISGWTIWNEVEPAEATRVWCVKNRTFMALGEECWQGGDPNRYPQAVV